jgi:putative FmdB family regulatory protein
MPTYDYVCKSCGETLETYQSITEEPLKRCPKCKKLALERRIGPGAAILFKGSGFYQTDYRSDSYKQAAQADQPASSTSKPTESSSDAKKSDATPPKSSSKAPKKPDKSE